ncbi:unnamed protein product [Ambrosiozyma monospora]|uniref:Unnamed protein product n=1 Tax=Ambrosiozyma monospora TaxID=43982 RepID=A0A9W6Z626_AMBMO|nr:unnamed protein product [Ambrosiozyma monospora]
MYNRSKRILLVPLLSREFEGDDKHIANMFIEECAQACGTLCLISKKLIQLEGFCVSFLVLQTVFLSAMTLIYCILQDKLEWSIEVSTSLQSCSTALFVIAERLPVTKKIVRDPFEKFLSKTMEHVREKEEVKRQTQVMDAVAAGKPDIPSPANSAATPNGNFKIGNFNVLDNAPSAPFQNLLLALDMPLDHFQVGSPSVMTAPSPQLSNLRSDIGSNYHDPFSNAASGGAVNVAIKEEDAPQLSSTSLTVDGSTEISVDSRPAVESNLDDKALHFQQQSDELWKIITDNTLLAWDNNGKLISTDSLDLLYGNGGADGHI